MRLLITATGLAVVIIGTLLLLNWWMVSCGRLACDIRPAWAAAEASTPDSCPPNIKAAATDAMWAKGVNDNLPDWQYKDPANGGKRTKTSGWFFADGTSTEKVISGEGSKADPDPLWQEAAKLLAAAPGINHPAAGAHPSASHAESKAAVWMRQNEITYGVAVINNREGPCGEQDPDARFACAAAIPAILPVGSTMVVWWWSDREGRMVSTSYEGTAPA